MGWYNGILNIDINQDPNNAPNYENLIKNYGSITMEQVLTSEQSYIAWEGRHAQDTHMLYQCLMISLTGEEKKKVMIWSDQYEFEVNGVEYNSGVALLKVIIRESHIDTNATTNQIRMKLSSLDTYMLTIECNVATFNEHVKLLIQQLKARNQTTSDLLINLIKGYSAVKNEEFIGWLKRKEEGYEDGTSTMTADELMQQHGQEKDMGRTYTQWENSCPSGNGQGSG